MTLTAVTHIICLTYQAFFDMHMMVAKPEQWVTSMADAGADQYTFHLEATNDALGLIRAIREAGMKVSTWSEKKLATFHYFNMLRI